jgi:hypothetical protein
MLRNTWAAYVSPRRMRRTPPMAEGGCACTGCGDAGHDCCCRRTTSRYRDAEAADGDSSSVSLKKLSPT